MSLPNIPNITPEINIDCEDAINLILSSVAREEMSLSHILDAESEKIQHVLCMHKNRCADLADVKAINQSAERMIEGITRLELLLQMKTQNVLELKEKCPHCCKPHCCSPCEDENPCCGHDECEDSCCPDPCFHPCLKTRLDYPQRITTERRFMSCS
jgi:hypothetical protein